MTSMQTAGIQPGVHLTGGHLNVGTLKAPRPSINDRASSLESTVEELDNALRHLRDRLEPILGPSTPRPGDTAANARGEESWLAEMLTSQTERIRSLILVVTDLSARVDL